MSVETLEHVVIVLKTAFRQGAEKDEPEGARYIQISEALTKQMIQVLEGDMSTVSTDEILKQVEGDERKLCAMVCNALAAAFWKDGQEGKSDGAMACAQAIRAHSDLEAFIRRVLPADYEKGWVGYKEGNDVS